MKRPILIALLVLSLLANVGFALQDAAKPRAWEYKFVQMKLDFKKTESALSELGAQGWEVVAVNENNGIANVYLKRAKQ